MRVLHVFDHSIPLQSGYAFRSRALLLAQRARGWETYHVTGAKQGTASTALEQASDGLAFHRTPCRAGPVARLPVLNQLAVIHDLRARLGALVRELAPDVIHAHSPALNGLAALQAGRRARVPVVYEIRAFWEDAAVDHGTSAEGGLRYRLTRALETYVARHAAAVCTICEGLRGDLVTRGIPAGRIPVIPNAVDVARFRFDAARDAVLEARFDLAGRPVLGFIGSFYAYEGLAGLVRALPALRARLPGLRVLLVGGGPCQADVARLVATLGLTDMVACTGAVPHAEVERYYSVIDALCYPRLPMRLTDLVTPLKPLEAMAQGKLVIASDVGGHRELIDDGRTGVLFRADDPAALADAIAGTLGRPERWPAMKTAARAFVERERNWPASVARYAPVYAQVGGR